MGLIFDLSTGERFEVDDEPFPEHEDEDPELNREREDQFIQAIEEASSLAELKQVLAGKSGDVRAAGRRL